MKFDGERRPEEIEAEIERTRASMDETLRAIEGRLTPGQLVDQGLDYLRHSGANEFVANLGESVKCNPLPVTLVGLGLAWLMMAERRGGAPAMGAGWGERTGEAMHRVSDAAHSVGERMSGAAQSAEDSMHRMSAAAGSAGQRLGDTAHAARESLSHAATAARESAARWGESGRHQLERARGSYERMVQEQPLALGAVGLALGAVIAAALPRTRQEDELMGESRDRLAEQAREAGREQLQKVEQVASAARQAAAGEAERQGLVQPTQQGRETGAGREAGKQAQGKEASDPFACPATDPAQGPAAPRPGR